MSKFDLKERKKYFSKKKEMALYLAEEEAKYEMELAEQASNARKRYREKYPDRNYTDQEIDQILIDITVESYNDWDRGIQPRIEMKQEHDEWMEKHSAKRDFNLEK